MKVCGASACCLTSGQARLQLASPQASLTVQTRPVLADQTGNCHEDSLVLDRSGEIL